MTIFEFAVTADVATVAVPDTKVTVPNELAPAVVVVATLVLMILLPAVPKTRLPFVAVMAPKVAVKVVADVIEPAVVVILPAVATILPVVAVMPVPPVKVVVEAIEPGAMNVDGIDNTTELPEAVVVI